MQTRNLFGRCMLCTHKWYAHVVRMYGHNAAIDTVSPGRAMQQHWGTVRLVSHNVSHIMCRLHAWHCFCFWLRLSQWEAYVVEVSVVLLPGVSEVSIPTLGCTRIIKGACCWHTYMSLVACMQAAQLALLRAGAPKGLPAGKCKCRVAPMRLGAGWAV
jgi:hypothetical protein